MSRRLTVGPFNRVEGDVAVTLDIAAGRVASAQVCSSLFRGFEQLLVGKHPLDAQVIVPGICGICSVSQSTAAAAAAAALAETTGLSMPANGRLASQLILGCENVADHLPTSTSSSCPMLRARRIVAALGTRRPSGVSGPTLARCCRRVPTGCG